MREQDVFVGNTFKNGIFHCKFKKGKLIKENQTNDFERCTYLAKNKSYLYSVIEIGGRQKEEHGYVVAYRNYNKQLINIDKKSSYGKGPCHIEISKKNKMLFVSNYIDGYTTIMKLNDNGTIGENIYTNVENKQKSHMHCIKLSKNEKFFFTVDLGENLIKAYQIKDEQIKEISRIQLQDDTQPRHIVVSRKKIYLVTEKSCELIVLKFINKKLSICDTISILPDNVEKKENYTGCAIKISKNLKNIYVTIRGHNSISVYKTSYNKVKMIQNISCEGNSPRDLELDKTQRYILVANQESNEIAIFKRNIIGGKLKYVGKEQMQSPTCIITK